MGQISEVNSVLECFLWKDLPEDVKASLTQKLPDCEQIPKDAELYRNGSLGYLMEGRGKILRLSHGGQRTTVRSITAGEIFGAAGVFGSWQGRSSIIASSPCLVRYVSEEQLREMMNIYPQIAINYISYLSDRIRFLNCRMDTFSAGSTEHKLYEFLRLQAKGDGTVELNFGMAELARRLKMSRSSLYRSLEVLEQNGFITREKNQFTVL